VTIHDIHCLICLIIIRQLKVKLTLSKDFSVQSKLSSKTRYGLAGLFSGMWGHIQYTWFYLQRIIQI